MKIAFLLVTRGNPKKAAAVIECARSLSGDDHKVEYLVGLDADDTESYNYFKSQYPGITLSVDARPKGVGAVANRLVRRSPDADIYCPFPDDVFISTPYWDNIIVDTFAEKYPFRECGVMAWTDSANLNQCTLPIVTREWITTVGELYDERFPFWFYDTCVDELFSFIMGRRTPIHAGLGLAARKGFTQRMRDLQFWWDLYVFTRAERLQKAEAIRKKLGIELHEGALPAVLQAWEARDVKGRESALEIEKFLAEREQRDPTPEYLAAKRDAEDLMQIERAA